LNTIHLSTRILCENINQLQDILSTISPSLSPQQANVCAPSHALVEECLGLIVDLEENSSVAVATLSDLINYDKIESKTFTIEKKDVNVWSVLEKTIQPLSLQAKEKNIEMELKTHLSHPSDFADVDVNPQHLRLVGDSIKLGQVIRNLVSNALKFTPANGTVKISGQ
jgi:signal transduction histidine kinase